MKHVNFTQVEACPRVKVSSLPRGLVPAYYFEELEQNQQIDSCCRHPENHEIEARKSKDSEPDPDVYIFTCTCGRQHARFCVGGGDVRPVWSSA
jgi:hypothetical protein